MGDPKKQRKKYKTPMHAWQKERIENEKEILKGYGLKNKKELWKMESVLRSFRSQAKKLVAQDTEQAKKEEEQLLKKLVKLNLIKPGEKIENVLDLELKDILDRRLQTQTLKQGMAKSMKQARQFITHKHICIGDNKVDVPSYLVSAEEEFKINFADNSGLSKDDHPERFKKETIGTKEKIEEVEKQVEEDIKEEPKKEEAGKKEIEAVANG